MSGTRMWCRFLLLHHTRYLFDTTMTSVNKISYLLMLALSKKAMVKCGY